MRMIDARSHRRASTTAFVLGWVLVATPGHAGLIPGGPTTRGDCYIEFDVDGVSGTSNRITCQDCDPSCDMDGAATPNGACTFKIKLCVNQTNVSGCTPAPFKRGPRVKKNLVPIPSTTGTEAKCGDTGNVVVKLKKGGKKKGQLRLQGVAAVNGSPKSDKDLLILTCTPRTTGTCPTITTTTTTSSTTTPTTIACSDPSISSGTLSFTTAAGTTSCGPAGLTTPPSPPVSGELDSDTAGSTKIADLGLGCLCFGGGAATVVACGAIPDGAASFLDITGPCTLGASAGTGARPQDNCTKGAGPGKHCVNNNSTPTCTGDGDCGGSAGSCGLDANCFFGPPLPIPSPPPFSALTTCVLNAVQSDASGSFDPSTGASTVSLPLSSRVYITGNTTSPCPKCVSGSCDPTWKTNTGTTSPDTGAACTPVGSLLTTGQCRPSLPGFQAPLPVDLTPLTTATAEKTAGDGLFCPGQNNAGAFGQAGALRIAETGMPAGSIADHSPHVSHLGSVFCIPATGNGAVDGVADLPGPGAIGLNGTAQIQ